MIWFRHDADASFDPKMQRLLAKHGPAGLGVYWAMVEMMAWDEEAVSDADLPVLAHQLYADEESVRDAVRDMVGLGLLLEDGGAYVSARAMAEVEGYRSRQRIGRLNAKKRWHPEHLTDEEMALLEE